MNVIEHRTLAVHTLEGIEHRTVAGLAQGLETLDVWQQRLRPGAATPPHHHHCEEVVVVLAGRGTVEIDGATREFAAGASIVIPPGVAHRILNTGEGDLELLGVFGETPARTYGPDGNLLDLPWNPPAFVPPGQMRKAGPWRMYR